MENITSQLNAALMRLKNAIEEAGGSFPEIKIKENVKSEQDAVNHPSHYETGKFECIDVMIETQGIEAVQNFCICNAFKYLYRHNRKNGIEDIKKAKWYIDTYIELSEQK